MGTAQLLTAEDLWKLGDRFDNLELIRGESVETTPPNITHGAVMTNIAMILGSFVKRHRLGRLYSGEVRVVIERNPDTVLEPDLSFLVGERVPADAPIYFQTPPDLVIEIVSPGNAAREIERKTGRYLESGVRDVWVVYSGKQQVVVHTAAGSPRTFHPEDHLTSKDILPGLSIPVADIFAD